MTKICEWCKCEFETKHGKARYCSNECAGMAHRKRCFLKREAKAKELGVTIEELEKMIKRGRVGITNYPKRQKFPKRPKTYKEIVAWNREHPLVEGWRR